MKTAIRITFPLFVLAAVAAVVGFFAPACSVSTGRSLSLSEAMTVIYRFRDSSMPPEYHRSYTITVTRRKAELVVDSYGKVLSETHRNMTEEEFSQILDAIRAAGIGRQFELATGSRCTGGTTESLKLLNGEKVIFDGTAYRCGNDRFGNLAGDTSAVQKRLVRIFPDFEEHLNTDL